MYPKKIDYSRCHGLNTILLQARSGHAVSDKSAFSTGADGPEKATAGLKTYPTVTRKNNKGPIIILQCQFSHFTKPLISRISTYINTLNNTVWLNVRIFLPPWSPRLPRMSDLILYYRRMMRAIRHNCVFQLETRKLRPRIFHHYNIAIQLQFQNPS